MVNKNRNRHTGHTNAFKKTIIDRGQKRETNGRIYYGAPVGKGFTIVRTK